VHAAPRDWLNFLAALPWQPCSSCCCGSNGCAVPSQTAGGTSVGAGGSSSTAQPGSCGC
jgi:hypothetical protein